MDWRLASLPWQAVFVFGTDGGKVLTGKDNTELLCELLHVHIAPASGQAIKRARKNFKEVRSIAYPISEEELAKRLPAVDPPPPAAPVVLPTEISADPPETEAPVELPEAMSPAPSA